MWKKAKNTNKRKKVRKFENQGSRQCCYVSNEVRLDIAACDLLTLVFF
jgi:hypothetical protein